MVMPRSPTSRSFERWRASAVNPSDCCLLYLYSLLGCEMVVDGCRCEFLLQLDRYSAIMLLPYCHFQGIDHLSDQATAIFNRPKPRLGATVSQGRLHEDAETAAVVDVDCKGINCKVVI